MKRIIKKIMTSILGDYNFKWIIAIIKRKSIHNYEEAEWIYRYFNESHKKGLMIDVGTHHGESFAPYINLGWRVYAFEPDPNNYEQIPRTKKLKIYNFAVSDHEEDSVSFFSSSESTGISSLSAFCDTHKEVAKVKLITLRKVIEQEQISVVNYLKIDAEGYDLFCLKGFPFEKVRPELILCEFEDRKSLPLGYSYKELGNFLLDKGYYVLISEWEPIVRYGVKQRWHSVKKFPSKLDNDKGWGNFIALNREENLNKILCSINKYIK